MARSSRSVRSRRSRQVGGASVGRPAFFNIGRFGGSSAGRAPWRARLVSGLLRPVPPGYIDQEGIRATSRILGDLRARRARIAPTRLVGALRQALPARPNRVMSPLGKPVLFRRSSPCLRRGQRREVMFAAGVAGKSWRRGGPRMENARFSVESQYRCV